VGDLIVMCRIASVDVVAFGVVGRLSIKRPF
jgi:hypothetical protein